MSNKLIHLTSNIDTKKLDTPNTNILKIDGRKVTDQIALFSILQKEFRLPDVNNWDAIADWLTDLSWFDKNNFIVYIFNYSSLLRGYPKEKDIFFRMLLNTVEWWDGDVEKYVVGGEKRSFNVYLVG